MYVQIYTWVCLIFKVWASSWSCFYWSQFFCLYFSLHFLNHFLYVRHLGSLCMTITIINFAGIGKLITIYIRSDTMKSKYVVLNSNLMKPDFPHNMKIRLVRLNFVVVSWLCKVRTQQKKMLMGPILFLYYEESLVSSNLNSKLLWFLSVRPNVDVVLSLLLRFEVLNFLEFI